jgi:hypothetical protein
MFKLTTDGAEGQTPEITQTLDDLVREGARRMLAVALEAEVKQYVEALRHLRDENGHAPWWFGTGSRITNERFTWELAASRFERPGWMIGGPSTALAADFCRPTCGARPVWKRLRRFGT